MSDESCALHTYTLKKYCSRLSYESSMKAIFITDFDKLNRSECESKPKRIYFQTPVKNKNVQFITFHVM